MVQTPTAKPGRRRNPPPRRAFGRSLSDFGELSAAERKLLDSCRIGEYAAIADTRPEEETEQNRVRGPFIRFLVLGGDEVAPVHEQGVLMEGAWINGAINLEASSVPRRLALWNCTILRIEAAQASLKSLEFNGTRLIEGFMGDGLQCEGDVLLRYGFHSTGEVRLLGATISGDLDCNGGHFENAEEKALSCDRAKIGGGVFLAAGFRAEGEVRMLGTTVGGNLDCTGGRFENGKAAALSCDRAFVSGNIFLEHGFEATGTVRLVGTRIGVNLGCTGGSFQNPQGTALCCDGARITGAFFFRGVTKIDGDVELGMHAETLCDQLASWATARGRLTLDGFTYSRFTGGAPTDFKTRIAWLELQPSQHLDKEFRPQPWEQLIKILREMGHPDEARAVAVEKQERLRKAGRISRAAVPFHWLYGALVGYGYRPLRLVSFTICVWALWAAFYWAATNPASRHPHLLAPVAREGKIPRADYPNFVPLIYSADVLLPVVDLGYKDEWQPVVSKGGKPLLPGQLLRFLYWFEIAFGWVAGLLLVGVLGNLIKKD